MRSLLFVLLAIVFVSCASKSGDKNISIPLFNDCSFRLSSDEQLMDPTASSLKKYELYFNNTTIQIPLYRHIKHGSYDLFLGIPIGSSVNEIGKMVMLVHDSTSTHYVSDSSFCYNQHFADSLYITELALKVGDKSVFYISSITANKAMADSLFTSRELLLRISKGKG